jgi:hypothetical protein
MPYQAPNWIDRDAQLAGGVDDAHRVQIEGRLKNVHTMLPGIIISFDAEKQTAQVQPAIQRVFSAPGPDGNPLGPVNLPPCVDVPVAFPGGGDFFLTFPVKPGDECILLFSERAIDYWYAYGGVQLPAEYRLHDLSDAVAVVGLNSQPRKLADVQTTGAELRTRDRGTYLRLEAGTLFIKGNVQLEGNLNVTGQVTASVDVIGGGKSLKSHTHGGVQPGGGHTGVPD